MFQPIKDIINGVLPDATVYVQDPRRDGIHIIALVISDTFTDMPLVEQHQLVMNAFSTYFAKDQLHALGLKTFTPEKWEKKKDSFTNLL